MNGFIKNLKIRKKIFLIISIFVLGFISFDIYSMYSLSKVKVNGPMYKSIIEGKDLVADVLPPPEYIIESYLLSFQMINETNSSDIDAYIEQSKNLEQQYYDRNKYWKKTLVAGKLKDLLVVDSYKPAVEFFNVRDNEFIPAIKTGDMKKAAELINGKLKNAYKLHREKIDEVVKLANEGDAAVEKNVSNNINTTTIILVVLAAVITIIAVVLSSKVSKAISDPIIKVTNMLRDISEEQGDLTKRLDVVSKDEIGNMASYFNKFISDVHSIVTKVVSESRKLDNNFIIMSGNIKELNNQIESISSISSELSSGSEETAAAIEEVNAATTDIKNDIELFLSRAKEGAASAEVISEKAVRISDGAVLARKNADEIYHNVNIKLVNAIEQSKNINRISETLDTIFHISTQTNILALNATIEAARAGEYGKGFAVVADQVRQLAQDTKTALEAIQKDVKTIVGSVDSLVGSSKEILEFVDTNVKKDYDVLVDISRQYNKDALYYNRLSLDISGKAEEIDISVSDISNAMDGITSASNDSASGTTDISNKTTYAETKSNEVVSEVSKAKTSVDKLIKTVSKFKI